VNVEKISWGDWSNCYRLSAHADEMIVTADVGPRIMAYNRVGGVNILFNFPHDLGKVGGDDFRFYGGHRFWHAPEHPQRTYQPDNAPVDVAIAADSITFTSMIERATGIQKTVHIHHNGNEWVIEHRLTNHNLWAITCAAWALTMMAPGGVAVLPLPPRASHDEVLIPTGQLALWAYTDLSDPRWQFGHEFILLRQDPTRTTPQKIGALLPSGWLAYLRDGTLFHKRFDTDVSAMHPDYNSNVELFTDGHFLELETLSPSQTLQPGASIVHREYWSLQEGVLPALTPADVAQNILPRTQNLLEE